MRLAYLCNLYPAVSHSFVRREIQAIEREGHDVCRFSIRPARSELPDPADQSESFLTECVLNQGAMKLFFAWLSLLVRHPLRSIAAIKAAYRLSGPGVKSKIRHAAYLLEATWITKRIEQLDLVHLHAHFGTNPAAVALLVSALSRLPFSFTVHGPDEFDAPISISLPAKIEAASFVVAISSYGRSQLMRWTKPRMWQKLKIVRCGVDDSFLNARTRPIAPQSKELLCVARLSSQKGLPLLVRACERLHSEGVDFTLTIVGDGEMRLELESEIRTRGLGNYVTLAGARSSEEIRAYLERARAMVLPSFAEGLPVVLMEALALGRPVIATAIAGIPELIDSQCGWLIDAGSEEALAEAIRQALACPVDELQLKGARGQMRVRMMHDVASNTRALLTHFMESAESTSA